ncbi:hypothetical protein R1sor_016536 [Riccia sorocarpa]|uniref:C2H2-type domain-containing protein n=1 Tax=Riccia sorocarpa TaxID=122646 RepID=A0ABD3HFA8_9MARC
MCIKRELSATPSMMAPTLSSMMMMDSCLHNATSPFLLSSYSHLYGGYGREFSPDRGSPLAPVPPALLPSGTINLPSSSYSQPEHFKMSNGLPMQPLSTPVMHPNLVMTLKSIISQQPCENAQAMAMKPGGGGAGVGAGASPVVGSPAHSNGSPGVTGMFNNVCPPAPPKQEIAAAAPTVVSTAAEADDDEAAVVPVDLIQNRRPFKCAHAGCNKTFKNPQTMKMHHKTHYSDDSSYRLGTNAHVLSALPSSFKAGHNKKIPSRCPICKKTFVGLYELRRHFGRKHSEGEKSFGCKKCGKKFYIEVDLRDHEKLCGEPIECKCGMKFAFKCNLVAHKKGHPECQDNPPPPPPPAASACEAEQKTKQETGNVLVGGTQLSQPASAGQNMPGRQHLVPPPPSSLYNTSMNFSGVGLEASGMHLPPLWSTLSPPIPQEASILPPFLTGDATLVSSKPFLDGASVAATCPALLLIFAALMDVMCLSFITMQGSEKKEKLRQAGKQAEERLSGWGRRNTDKLLDVSACTCM